jgi:hypothetical protein
MELGWINFSLSYLIHVCMEQEERLALLCGGCGWLWSSLDHMHHWNRKGVDSLVGFLSIIFVWLINLQCVQQLGSNIEGSDQNCCKSWGLQVLTSSIEIGSCWYQKGTNNTWTYKLTCHLMVYVETIIALTSMTYIVDLNAYELHPRDEKVFSNFIHQG